MKKKYAKGTDTVDAKLTPREAVLNRNAAELLGRDAISRLNAHGNMLAKRGVDLASLPSDPTPGPSTENMLGYQYGTSTVQSDDRDDLLRDADTTFYGGGQAPMPTPTPTPKPNGYQYGTEDVRRRRNAASRFTSNYSPLTTATQGVRIGGQYGGAGATLAPEDNPAYQAAIAKGRPAASSYTWITTPSGGQMKVPTASIGALTRKGSDLQGSTFSNVPAGFGRPNAQTSYAMGDTGAVPTGNTAFEKSYRMGFAPSGVTMPPPTLGYQIGSAISNFSPVGFGQGLVNAASRIGQGIANVFTGGNTQAAPVPNAAPTPPPIPQQSPAPVVTPTPTPTIPPNDNPYGFQYGTASVPRRYSDYY